jgi:uncharacterized protein (DUF952 family)
MLIYKIFRGPEWAELVAKGKTPGAPIDVADGFVHFSTATQAAETAARYFAGVSGLVLVALESDALGDKLVWEPSRGGQLFPHLYRDLTMADVLSQVDLPLGADGHVFPDTMV